MFAIRGKILFFKCNCWKWKIKLEIKVNGEYIEGTTIFVFHNFYSIHTTFFYKQSISDPRPEYCLSFSKKSLQKIV